MKKFPYSYKRISISLSEKTYKEICEISHEYNMSLSHVLNIFLEQRLEDYFSKKVSINEDKADAIYEIEKSIHDNSLKVINILSEICLNISEDNEINGNENDRNTSSDFSNQKKKRHRIFKFKKDSVSKQEKVVNEELYELLEETRNLFSELKEDICQRLQQ